MKDGVDIAKQTIQKLNKKERNKEIMKMDQESMITSAKIQSIATTDILPKNKRKDEDEEIKMVPQ